MRAAFSWALALASLLAAGPRLCAQSQGNGSDRNQPAANSRNAPAAQTPPRANPQNNQNAFPEDTSDIPVIPSGNAPVLFSGGEPGRMPVPVVDADPVRSPEDAAAAAENNEQNSSSSMAGMSDLLPPADDETQTGRHRRAGEKIVPEHHETAAEDESVGNYYLDNQDWKGALSRYQSALVLDPDNPDVYWGLAECERHLGQFAEARANYEKVIEYDPGSHHAKEARKALRDPEIANAKPSPAVQPTALQQ